MSTETASSLDSVPVVEADPQRVAFNRFYSWFRGNMDLDDKRLPTFTDGCVRVTFLPGKDGVEARQKVIDKISPLGFSKIEFSERAGSDHSISTVQAPVRNQVATIVPDAAVSE